MLGSTILDVAIGIVFIFLLVSLMASAVREGLEAWLNTRASHLEAGLREILRDPDGTGLVQQFYDHPLIYSLFSGKYTPNAGVKGAAGLILTRGRNLPAYIPSSNFALALMDMAARGPQTASSPSSTHPVTLQSIRDNLGTFENAAVQRALLVALDHAEGDLQQMQTNLEAWYNSAMDRVSGWYKRSSQAILLTIGLLIAVALNINTIRIGNTLYHDRTTRDLVVASAEKVQSNKQLSYSDASTQLGLLNLPIGWPQSTHGLEDWASDLAGWLLTAFAVSFGAPFWFDMLNRLIVVRSTVKPHQKSPEEGSADRASDGPIPATPPPAVPVVAPPGLDVQAGAAAAGPPEPMLGLETAPQAAAPELDGCDVSKTDDITTDEMLPAAAGGVRA